MSWRQHLLPSLTLLGIVLASAIQTEVAHTLNADWGYTQPYWTFWITHSTFALVFPIHLAVLAVTHPSPWRSHMHDIRLVLADQLALSPLVGWPDIARAYGRKVTWLTVLISLPALAWFVAMLYSPAMDITAIYATSSFWAYFFSMWMLGQPLSRVTTGSIALAFAGVVVLSLDGLGEGDEEGGRARAFGDVVMMVGAILLGLYEVVYKTVLPEGNGGVDRGAGAEYDPLPAEEYEHPADGGHGVDTRNSIESDKADPADDGAIPMSPTSAPRQSKIGSKINRKASRTPLLSRTSSPPPIGHAASIDSGGDADTPADLDTPHPHLPLHHLSAPPRLPPALHANFLTSCIGVATFGLLWPALVLFHWLGWESFRWPAGEGVTGGTVWTALLVVALGGAIYNAGLMILIGLWGPTTSSVANLLTIGMVAVIDAVLMGLLPSFQTLLGVGMICIGFGVLVWEGEG